VVLLSVSGIVLYAGGTAVGYFGEPSTTLVLIGCFAVFAGHIMVALACIDLARLKGWSLGIGVFFAVFGIVGLIGLTQLSERPRLEEQPD
jgi:hypothetical protein